MLESLGKDDVKATIAEECNVFNLEEVERVGEDALVIHWSRTHVTAAVEASQTAVSVGIISFIFCGSFRRFRRRF